jgi:hypothetical protein
VDSIVRHRVLTDWEAYAASQEEAFGEPIIVDHLEAMADVPGVFASVFGNLARDLAAQPWLAEEAGYSWVTERGAYRFAAEALNQSRVLNALGGLIDAEDRVQRRAAAGIVARQALAWRVEDAEPYCHRAGPWRFVVLPFGWDNVISLMILALRGHGQSNPVFSRLFPGTPEVADWRAAAKGLLLAAIPLPEARAALVDSFVLDTMRKAHPWLEGAIFSLADHHDPVVRTLASISTDWVIGHEVGHALLHETTPWSLEREMQADRAGLVQLVTWSRPRDLTGLAPDLSPNFWDYLSARIGLMMLTLAADLQHRSDIAPASGTGLARQRSASLRAALLERVAVTTITPEELGLIDALDSGFEAFVGDLARLRAEMPAWAEARARHAARAADEIVRAELAAHKASGGGPVLPT